MVKEKQIKSNMNTTMVLTRDEAIIAGYKKRQKMIAQIKRATEVSQTDAYGSCLIASNPGLGKTTLAKMALEESESDWCEVNGLTSIFAFGIQLALINANNPLMLTVNILVDDCDTLFREEASLNVLKSVISNNGKFQYEKSLSNQMTYLTDAQKHAIQTFSSNERMGFTVPTHNMRFIFLSNLMLASEAELLATLDKPATRTSILKVHQHALRSRLRIGDYRKLSNEEHYGWIAYVILEELDIPTDHKLEITSYLWDHWFDLSEKSIRTGEKMSDIMLYNPDNYREIWNEEFLKS